MLTAGLFWRRSAQRIFISYRREDSQWAAGRLSDSLAAYFGDERVFRDIEDIAGGADFGDVIHETLGAADAVVVLIGKEWLGASDAGGRRRLDDPADWVAREIAGALAKGVPVYPVLLEGTPMPRREELPEALWPLTRYNAVSISDSRWRDDVARLAKIVALDIPSATERQLQAVNLAITVALFLTLTFTLSTVFWTLFNTPPVSREGGASGEWEWRYLFQQIGDTGMCAFAPDPWFTAMEKWQSGVIFIAVVASSSVLLVFARHIDEARRAFVYAAAWTGGLGSLAAFVLFLPLCEEYETMVLSYLGMLLASLMLALLGLSGFKPK